eukprot:SAG22_NODE_10165_length_549_cov_2.244444_1_plen_172_part_01
MVPPWFCHPAKISPGRKLMLGMATRPPVAVRMTSSCLLPLLLSLSDRCMACSHPGAWQKASIGPAGWKRMRGTDHGQRALSCRTEGGEAEPHRQHRPLANHGCERGKRAPTTCCTGSNPTPNTDALLSGLHTRHSCCSATTGSLPRRTVLAPPPPPPRHRRTPWLARCPAPG